MADPVLGERLKSPSVSVGAAVLFAHGVFADETRPNLGRRMCDLAPGEGPVVLTVNDKALAAPLRVALRYSSASAMAT
eukprot:363694-Chlamydomonas_euryale.AAC.5